MKNKDNKNKEKIPFKVLWKNPFYNALIKLGIWILFFIILFLIVSSIGSRYQAPVKNAKLSLIDAKNNLINHHVNVKYQIGDYYILGNIQNNILNGTLEDNNDLLIKIKYDGNNFYQLKKEEEIVNNEVLNDINKSYLIPKYIIDLVSDPSIIGIKSNDGLSYSYSFNNIAVTIYMNEKEINKIIILDNNITYNLEYEEVVNEEEK